MFVGVSAEFAEVGGHMFIQGMLQFFFSLSTRTHNHSLILNSLLGKAVAHQKGVVAAARAREPIINHVTLINHSTNI